MENRFLQYYERELRFIREMGAEFARSFPKVAGRLGLSELKCDDPHVERLFQGFAFTAGRVHQALDAEFPAFTQPFVELLYRNYFAPTPAMGIAQFSVDGRSGSLADGFAVPRDTVLAARTPARDGTACEFRTAHPVQLLPISIERLEYTSVLRDIADLRVPTREPIRALLKLSLRSHNMRFERVSLQELPLFVQGADEISACLFEQLITSAATVVMRWGPDPNRDTAVSTAARPVRALGFDEEHALLPRVPNAFEGYRLLHEYFACPPRFDFVELTGLASGISRCSSDRLELIVPLTRFSPALEGSLDASRLQLFATPIINLFPVTCGRIVAPRYETELEVVPDATRPLDFEVHSLTHVAAYAGGSDVPIELKPAHCMHATLDDAAPYRYALQRRTETFPERRSGARAPYTGSGVWLRLLEPHSGAMTQALQQLSAVALCTNRDLPLCLSLGRGGNDFDLRSGVPAAAVRCIHGPTAPRTAPPEGDASWRLLSYLSLNYLSLSGQTGGVEALRELLGLYAQLGDPTVARHVEGVSGIRSAPAIGPLPRPGPRTFVRGLEIELQCEEQAFAGRGALTLASVMAAFFAKHAASNSFAQTVLTTRERGEIYRWPAAMGLRHVL